MHMRRHMFRLSMDGCRRRHTIQFRDGCFGCISIRVLRDISLIRWLLPYRYSARTTCCPCSHMCQAPGIRWRCFHHHSCAPRSCRTLARHKDCLHIWNPQVVSRKGSIAVLLAIVETKAVDFVPVAPQCPRFPLGSSTWIGCCNAA